MKDERAGAHSEGTVYANKKKVLAPAENASRARARAPTRARPARPRWQH
jgi:hypothetical protein